MPPSLTRVCVSCSVEKVIRDFRDPGDRLGRPPKACAACRAKSPALLARQAANVARRDANVAEHRGYADRPDEAIAAHRRAIYPDGLKTCPDGAGCGKTLPVSAFGPGRYQPSGLATVCAACTEATRLLHS